MIQHLQAMLVVGAALPELAVEAWWSPGAWAKSVRGAGSLPQLRRCLACLEAAARLQRVSVAFCRNPVRVRGAWLPTREPLIDCCLAQFVRAEAPVWRSDALCAVLKLILNGLSAFQPVGLSAAQQAKQLQQACGRASQCCERY